MRGSTLRQQAEQWLASRTRLERWAWGLWSLTIAVTSILVFLKPHRSVTHIYRDATLHWWAGEPLYAMQVHGFLYLPSSAVLYSPLAWLPPLAGSMGWRWLSAALFTWAVVRLARVSVPEAARATLALALLVMIPAATVNLVRAQSEMIMAALMIHAAVDLAGRRWWPATLGVCLAVAIKPLALVMLLLTGALVPAMRLRLLLGLLAVLALPFLHPDPGYVATQYGDLVREMAIAVDPGSGRWNELTAVLARLGLRPDRTAMDLLRVLAALATLGLTWAGFRRHGHVRGTELLLGLAICYQLLFNPRTEEGSYLNLAAIAGMAAGRAWFVTGRKGLAQALIALGLGLGAHTYGDWIYRPTDLWLKPTLALAFIGFLVWQLATRPEQPGAATAAAAPQPAAAGG
jgi:hypothetical protein